MAQLEIGNRTEANLVQGWSVQEGTTPASVNGDLPGYGGVNVTIPPVGDDEFLIDESVRFVDDTLGTISGYVDGSSLDVDDHIRGGVSFDIATTLNALNTERRALPVMDMPLSSIIQAYVNLATNELSTDYQATSDPVLTFPSWEGNVWEHLNALCAINRVEIVVVDTTVVVRDMGGTVLQWENSSLPNVSFDDSNLGREIDVTYQNPVSYASIEPNIYNYVLNPSFEGNTSTGWTVTATQNGMPVTPTLSTPTGISYSGNRSLRAEYSPSAPNYIVTYTYDVPKSSVPYNEISAGAWTRGVSLFYNDVFDITVSVKTISNAGTVLDEYSVTGGNKVYNRIDNIDISPSTNIIRLSIVFEYKSGYPSLVSTYVDAGYISNGAGEYFDGNTTGASWTGTANASISSRVNTSSPVIYDAAKDDQNILSVEAGKVSTGTLTAQGYPVEVYNPVPTDNFFVLAGQYHVIDAVGIPIAAQTWLDFGGRLDVGLGEGLQDIDYILTGPTSDVSINGGPYSLSASYEYGEEATLKIIGSGVATDPVSITVLTGADPVRVREEKAPAIESPFVDTIETAYNAAHDSAVYNNSSKPVISFVIPVNDIVGFGLTPGTVFNWRENKWRVISTTINDGGTIEIDAGLYVTHGDFLAINDTKSYTDMTNAWNLRKYKDLAIKQLRVL